MFKLALLGSGQTFALVTPELSVPGVSPEVLQRVLSQATRSMFDGLLFASSPFCRLAYRGALVRGFRFRWALHFVLYLIRGVALHDSACCSREDYLGHLGAHALHYLVFPFLPYGFGATNPYWYWRPNQRRILT